MKSALRILIVSPSPSLAATLVRWLGEARHELVLVTTFAAAKLHLKSRPDVLVTEVRLGAYNGLHVALRAQAAGVPALVLGPPDEVCVREAEDLGSAYLCAPTLEFEALLATVDQLVMLSRAEQLARVEEVGELTPPPSAMAFDSFDADAALPSALAARPARAVVLH